MGMFDVVVIISRQRLIIELLVGIITESPEIFMLLVVAKVKSG